jgi:DNA-binding MarR family transcriptional regulator
MSETKRFSAVISEWTGIFMRRSTIEFNRFMRDSGLSMPQFHTMLRLYYRKRGGVSDIAEDVGFTKAASSQMIDRLVQEGLLERAENPEDRREKVVTLSENGHSMMDRLIAERKQWMENLTIALTPDEQERIIDALTLLSRAARELEKHEQIP